MSVALFPVIIQNNSGYDPEDIYITAIGINNINPMGQQFYNFLSQKWQNKECSNCLKNFRQDNGNHVLDLPYIESGIVFISMEKPLVFNVSPNGISQPDFSNPDIKANPSFYTIYDKFEITYLEKDGFPYINTTNVDFYCLSLSLQETLEGGKRTKLVGFTKSRQEVLDKFTSQLVKIWATLIQNDNMKRIVRVVAPNKAVVDMPSCHNNFDAKFFQFYIDAVWDFYSQPGNTVTVDMTEIATWNPDYNNVLFTGRVVENQFVFSGKSSSGASLPDIAFEKPGGSDCIKMSVFGCAGLFNAPNQTPRSVPAKNLGAAFNVGLLAHPKYPGKLNLTPEGWSQYKSDFYNHTMNTNDGEVDCYNLYAGILHSNSEGGSVYGFAYADVTQSDSTLSEKDAKNAIVTIGRI